MDEGVEEGLPVLGRHDVVDDGVDCRVEMEKNARDVKKFLVNCVVYFVRNPIQPEEKI